MKNLFFPAILFAVAMNSCSKDETHMSDYTADSDLVAINVYAGTTKGTDTTTESLETAGIVELHIDDSNNTKETFTFTYADKDWSQTDTDQITWSSIVFPANFYSLHDGKAFDDLNFTNDVATYRDYEVSETSSESHSDLVYHASKLIAIPADGQVSVYHKHALSKINLYAATGTNNVYIARVRVVNVDSDGTITITPLDSDAEDTEVGALWTLGTTNFLSYTYFYIGSETTATAKVFNSTTSGSNPIINTSDSAPLMIIPQTTTAIDADEIASGTLTTKSYVEVIYYMTDSSNNPLVGYSSVKERSDAESYSDDDQGKTLYVKAAFPLGYTFAINMEYDITLGLGVSGSSGGILIDDFYVDKDGSAVTLTKLCDSTTDDVDITDIDEGDDILENVNSVIDIIVSAYGWSDGTDTTLEYTEVTD